MRGLYWFSRGESSLFMFVMIGSEDDMRFHFGHTLGRRGSGKDYRMIGEPNAGLE
jgi:hypothetical protein